MSDEAKVPSAPKEDDPPVAKPTEAKPVAIVPPATTPPRVGPPEAKPAEAKPAEAKAAETKPAETKPVETKPTPVGSRPTGRLAARIAFYLGVLSLAAGLVARFIVPGVIGVSPRIYLGIAAVWFVMAIAILVAEIERKISER